MYLSRRLLLGVVAIMFTCGVYAEDASITNVQNELSEDASTVGVVVTGTNFGERPDILYYNDFRRDMLYTSVGTGGQLAGITRLRAGSYPMVGSMDGAQGFYVVDDSVDKITILEVPFVESQSRLFLAYAVGIPPGKTAPMMTEPKIWYEGSSWKLNWLLETPTAYSSMEEFDLCAPTFVGKNVMLAGNASKFATVPDGYTHVHAKIGDWWAWDSLNHIQVTFDGNTTNPANSTGAFSVVNKAFKYVNFPHNTTGSVYQGPIPKITQINFPGWFRPSLEDNFQALYTNIYVATGANYLSRVEVTDSEEYNLSTYRRVVFPIDWSSTRIKFNIYKSELKTKGTLYFHYFDFSGRHIGSGRKACPHCPVGVDEGSSSSSAG